MRPPGAPSATGNTIYGASRTCKKLRGQRPLGAEIQSSEKSPVGWVNMRAYNVFVSGPKFTNFFHPIGDETLLIKYLSDFRYVDPFQRYLRSNSKVVRNRAKYLYVFVLPHFIGGPLPKVVHTSKPLPLCTPPGEVS